MIIEEQEFYCKKCKKPFVVKNEEKYINYNCPDCNEISPFRAYSGLKLSIPGGTIKG